MQTYPTKSGRTYFFAGLLFALILGGVRLLDAAQRTNPCGKHCSTEA